MIEKIKYFYIKWIYADHNSTKRVIRAIESLLFKMPEDGCGLNIGAGRSKIDSRFKNLEIEAGENIDYVGSVESIPLPDESIDLVITQEVLEHVADPNLAMKEIYRVLKPGGVAYIQLPFIIGYHPCPNDYWRFTHEGIEELAANSGLTHIETGITVGPATGFYRISVEFWSILFSTIIPIIYKPLKAVFSLLLYPIKLLDYPMMFSEQRNRIAGGYFVICEKIIK